MKIVAQPKEWIAQMVAHFQGIRDGWGNYNAIALVGNDGLFRAGVIYNHFEAQNVCMHVAIAPGARLTPAFIRAAFEYPFIQLGKARVTGLVPRKNKKAIRFNRKLGFQYEGCLRRYFGDEDLMVYGMLKSECTLLPQEAERKAA